jgi:hypothetical protein
LFPEHVFTIEEVIELGVHLGVHISTRQAMAAQLHSMQVTFEPAKYQLNLLIEWLERTVPALRRLDDI